MTRRARHSRTQVAVAAIVALTMSSNAVVGVYLAARTPTLAMILAATALGYVAMLLLILAAVWGVSWAWHGGRPAHRPRWQPTGRNAPGTGMRPVADGYGRRRVEPAPTRDWAGVTQ